MFSINPSLEICRRWLQVFKSLVSDAQFQEASCRDVLHKIFLHQAVLSALIMNEIDIARIRLLPTDYSFPLHLSKITGSNRAKTLNELTHVVYEEEYPHPDSIEEIEILEQLRSWLITRVPAEKNSL